MSHFQALKGIFLRLALLKMLRINEKTGTFPECFGKKSAGYSYLFDLQITLRR